MGPIQHFIESVPGRKVELYLCSPCVLLWRGQEKVPFYIFFFYLHVFQRECPMISVVLLVSRP